MSALSNLSPVNPHAGTSLVEAIMDSLRTSITSGDLEAGFRLREIPLSEHFGCSTTPVREAIRKLESEGLVKVNPRRGAEVVSVSHDDMEALFETRIVLESYAVAKAARSMLAAAALDPARKVVDSQRKAGKRKRGTMLDGELEFHRAVTMLCGNRLISDIVDKTLVQIEAGLNRARVHAPEDQRSVTAVHAEILEAIASGRSSEAEELMREHLRSTAQSVRTALSAR